MNEPVGKRMWRNAHLNILRQTLVLLIFVVVTSKCVINIILFKLDNSKISGYGHVMKLTKKTSVDDMKTANPETSEDVMKTGTNNTSVDAMKSPNLKPIEYVMKTTNSKPSGSVVKTVYRKSSGDDIKTASHKTTEFVVKNVKNNTTGYVMKTAYGGKTAPLEFNFNASDMAEIVRSWRNHSGDMKWKIVDILKIVSICNKVFHGLQIV